MKFNLTNIFKKEAEILPVVNESSTSVIFSSVLASPTIKEKTNSDFVYYGDDNNYPNNLNDLIKQSPMQSAIIMGKARMMAGSSFLFNHTKTKEESDIYFENLDQITKDKLNLFLGNPNDSLNIFDIKEKMKRLKKIKSF
jgi:hypothetical protein